MKPYIQSFIRCGLAGLLLAAGLSGCGRGMPIVSDTKENKVYSMPEMMLVVANERNRYELVYTEQVWDVAVDKEGTTFKDHLLDEVQGFLEDLRTMNLLAKEKGITLTEQEKDSLHQLARAYHGSLTERDLAYVQADQDDIYNIYAEYHLANKVVSELTGDINLEISDSDAKVITVMQIRIDDAATAREVYEKLQAEGADFVAIARTYTLDDEITMQIGRGERERSCEQAAFSLTTGQMSEVIPSGGAFYILKCVSDYEEAQTQERKQKLSLQRRSEAFRQIYDQFAVEHQVQFPENLFDGVVFSASDGTTTSNFFQMYQDYMNN